MVQRIDIKGQVPLCLVFLEEFKIQPLIEENHWKNDSVIVIMLGEKMETNETGWESSFYGIDREMKISNKYIIDAADMKILIHREDIGGTWCWLPLIG